MAEDRGRLAPSEARLMQRFEAEEAVRRLSAPEPASTTALRERLEDGCYATKKYREHHEAALKDVLPPSLPWEIIENYATARVREMLAIRQLEDCGWSLRKDGTLPDVQK
jgi:hypothetical protein